MCDFYEYVVYCFKSSDVICEMKYIDTVLPYKNSKIYIGKIYAFS